MIERLRSIRKAKGMTQGELAQATGINRVTIAKYEAGNFGASVTNAEKLANALDCRIEDLIGGGNNDTVPDRSADG